MLEEVVGASIQQLVRKIEAPSVAEVIVSSQAMWAGVRSADDCGQAIGAEVQADSFVGFL